MAMKQMPIESGEIPVAATMGLRVKKNGIPERDTEPPMTEGTEDPPFEEQLTSQAQFELSKKMFAQQMKDELLGRKPTVTKPP